MYVCMYVCIYIYIHTQIEIDRACPEILFLNVLGLRPSPSRHWRATRPELRKEGVSGLLRV